MYNSFSVWEEKQDFKKLIYICILTITTINPAVNTSKH